MSAKCPNCFMELENVPESMSRCKFCGEVIFVRDIPDLMTNTLFTFKDAMTLDLWMWLAAAKNLSAADFMFWRMGLISKNGEEPSLEEIVCGLAMSHQEYHRLAKYMWDTGEDYTPMKRIAFANDLRAFKEAGIEWLEITGTKNHCVMCESQFGDVDNVDALLDTQPLPCLDCAGYCECEYVPSETHRKVVALDELNSMLESFLPDEQQGQ